MSEKPNPMFKVGQVVMMKSLKKPLPFIILGILWETNEWYYQWNKKNYAAEHMIRELTDDEAGMSDKIHKMKSALELSLEVIDDWKWPDTVKEIKKALGESSI